MSLYKFKMPSLKDKIQTMDQVNVNVEVIEKEVEKEVKSKTNKGRKLNK
jgi:hypothetical protein